MVPLMHFFIYAKESFLVTISISDNTIAHRYLLKTYMAKGIVKLFFPLTGVLNLGRPTLSTREPEGVNTLHFLKLTDLFI